MHYDYVESAMRAPLPLGERLPILLFVARSAWWYRKQLWTEMWAKLLPERSAS
jgi:hypothetical protein